MVVDSFIEDICNIVILELLKIKRKQGSESGGLVIVACAQIPVIILGRILAKAVIQGATAFM